MSSPRPKPAQFKAILASYINIRVSQNLCQDPKIQTCIKFMLMADTTNSTEGWSNLATKLQAAMQKEWKEENSKWSTYVPASIRSTLSYYTNWVTPKKEFLLYRTLRAALVYIYKNMYNYSSVEFARKTAELGTDYKEDADVEFFNEVIKFQDPIAKGSKIQSYDEFQNNAFIFYSQNKFYTSSSMLSHTLGGQDGKEEAIEDEKQERKFTV